MPSLIIGAMGALEAAAGDLAVVVQPRLIVPLAIQARIASGELYRVGSVVRDVASKQFVTFLDEAPALEEVVDDAIQRVSKLKSSKPALSKIDLSKIDAKVAGGLLVVGLLAAGGVIWVMKKRKPGEAAVPEEAVVGELAAVEMVDVPECVINFRTSLEAYVNAGRDGALDADCVGQLVADLEAVQTYSEEGNAVFFTLDELTPFFEMVTAHTPALAEAYSVELDDLEEFEEGVGAANVLQLRRHLETQKRILADAA